MNNIPVIRLEVEGMRRSLCVALTEYSAQMDADLKAAVDSFCTPENIAHIVKTTANRVMEAVIREEVEKFFRFGEGRAAVAAAVKESILAKESYTPMDKV